MNNFRLAIVSLLCLAGCSAGYDMGMKVEKSAEDFEVLMGSFDGSVALIHGNPRNATFSATNGTLTCDGASSTGSFATDMVKNKIKHQFQVECSDGRNGFVTASITARPNGGFGGANITGAGVGKLNDGSKLKVVFGDASGTLGW